MSVATTKRAPPRRAPYPNLGVARGLPDACRRLAAAIGLACSAQGAAAQTIPAAPALPDDSGAERVVVNGASQRSTLNQANATASFLALTPRQIPASVDVIDQLTIRQQGYATVQDSVASAPGVTVGGSPADASSFQMRGFTGDQINLLRDGVYYGPSDLVNRPENSFNLADIEILKGPASVLYGQGAVGGVINVVTRQPTFTPTAWDALFSYGRFDSIESGLAVNGTLSPTVAINLSFSRTSSSGYVEHDDPDSLNVTGALLWRIRPDLRLQAGIDVLQDHLPSYYGTPLVPDEDDPQPIPGILKSSQSLGLDAATRDLNYNTADAVHKSTTISPSALLTWAPDDQVTLTDRAYLFYAERRWQNAETYTYVTPGLDAVDAAGAPIAPGSVARDRFYVYHQQHLYGDQGHVLVENTILGLRNRLTFGIDAYYLQFLRSRGFPDATYADAVSLLAPVQGDFGNFPGLFPQEQSPTQMADVAGLFEDALSVGDTVRLVAGMRDEWLRLNRQNYDQAGVINRATSFDETFNPTNFRVGVVYDVVPQASLYAQYTTAQDPPGADIFLANAGQIQGLTHSSQEEAGVKAQAWHDRLEATLAVYAIDRKNILIATSEDSVADVGSQNSRGVELATTLRLTPAWSVSANAAYTHAHYGTFIDPENGVDASGNRPPDVPTWTAAIFTAYVRPLRLPMRVGADVRYVGNRAGDFANTLQLDGYALVDIDATVHVAKGVDLTGRIDNLFNRTYVSWADTNYPSELLLGRPRYFELDLRVGI